MMMMMKMDPSGAFTNAITLCDITKGHNTFLPLVITPPAWCPPGETVGIVFKSSYSFCNINVVSINVFELFDFSTIFLGIQFFYFYCVLLLYAVYISI